MSRDLTTIAAVEGEKRRQLRDVRLANVNRRSELERGESEEAGLMLEIDQLEAEARAAFDRTRSAGFPEAPEPTSLETVGEAPRPMAHGAEYDPQPPPVNDGSNGNFPWDRARRQDGRLPSEREIFEKLDGKRA